MNTSQITLTTNDEVLVVGDRYGTDTPSERGALLLHMMPAVRESFREFGTKLAGHGIGALAIDLRGHGGSTRRVDGEGKSVLDFRTFSDSDHQASIHDVRAALAYMRKRGIGSIALVGASIGANLALQALAEDATLKGALAPVKLNHPHCAKFCVLGGGSCKA